MCFGCSIFKNILHLMNKETLVNLSLIKNDLEDMLVKYSFLTFPNINTKASRPRNKDITRIHFIFGVI